jgi:hypothetical protein
MLIYIRLFISSIKANHTAKVSSTLTQIFTMVRQLVKVVPDIWRIRIDMLIRHLETRNCSLFVKLSERYRSVPKEQCTYFTEDMLDELYDTLFDAEIYACVDVVDYPKQLLLKLKDKLFYGYNFKVEIMHQMEEADRTNTNLGDLYELPNLARQLIGSHLRMLL